MIVCEKGARVELYAKFIVRLADLHAHPLIPAIEMVETQALGEGLVLSAYICFRAECLIVGVPVGKD